MPKLKGGKVGSIKTLKRNIKRSSQSGDRLVRIGADESLTGYFLTEPDEWQQYDEHYMKDHQPQWYFPCVESDCEGCDAGERSSNRHLASFLNTDENMVVPLVIPVTLAEDLVVFFDRYGTLMDRPYELMRTGSGKNDTSYKALPEAPNPRFKLDRFTPLDLNAVLLSQLPATDDDDDDDDEDEDEPIRPKRRMVAKPMKKKIGR
jgi:hypothetical protein